jgi:hypothetical protein
VFKCDVTYFSTSPSTFPPDKTHTGTWFDVCDGKMADEKEIIQPSGTSKAMDEEKEFEHKTAAQKMNNDARLATEKEHNMTLWQGIKLYPKAVGWSVLISTCIAMEGYDLCLLSNFYGFPQFNRYVVRDSLP